VCKCLSRKAGGRVSLLFVEELWTLFFCALSFQLFINKRKDITSSCGCQIFISSYYPPQHSLYSIMVFLTYFFIHSFITVERSLKIKKFSCQQEMMNRPKIHHKCSPFCYKRWPSLFSIFIKIMRKVNKTPIVLVIWGSSMWLTGVVM
jgi:hypothetical protein